MGLTNGKEQAMFDYQRVTTDSKACKPHARGMEGSLRNWLSYENPEATTDILPRLSPTLDTCTHCTEVDDDRYIDN